MTQRAWSARPGCVRSVSVTARFRTFGLLGPQDQTLTHSTLTLRPDPGTRCHGHPGAVMAHGHAHAPSVPGASRVRPDPGSSRGSTRFPFRIKPGRHMDMQSHTHNRDVHSHSRCIQVAGPVAPFTFTTHPGRLRWPLATQPCGIGRAVLTVDTYIHMAAITRGDQSPSAPSTRPGPSSPFPAQPPSRCVPPQGPRS